MGNGQGIPLITLFDAWAAENNLTPQQRHAFSDLFTDCQAWLMNEVRAHNGKRIPNSTDDLLCVVSQASALVRAGGFSLVHFTGIDSEGCVHRIKAGNASPLTTLGALRYAQIMLEQEIAPPQFDCELCD